MTIDGKDHLVRGETITGVWKWFYLRWTDDYVWRLRGIGDTVMEAHQDMMAVERFR